jgi:UDP-N-acetylmuramate dehydrogenase
MEQPAPGCYHVGAGYSFSLLGTQTARQGWEGLEFASGIPGSVGGAVFMNAGANGSETCKTLISVDYVTEEGSLEVIPKENLHFSYRYSSFQIMHGAIVGATFQLTQSQTARQKQLEIIGYRTKTQPYGEKSAGCVFRNPNCGHAGALIDQTGLKGLHVGDAKVSEMHANFIVNSGKATCLDVLNLIEVIKKKVKENADIELEPEIRYIPYGKEDT